MTDKEPPRLYTHALALYEAINSDSTDNIWEGSLVAVFRSLGISQSYYTPIYRVLKELGSIEVLHAGRGGGARSRVRLHEPPLQEDFAKVYRSPLTNSTALDKLTLRVETLERRMPDIDLPSYITDLERRLELLEKQVAGEVP